MITLPIIWGWLAYSITFYIWINPLLSPVPFPEWFRKFFTGIIIYLIFFLPYLNWKLFVFLLLINGLFLGSKKWRDFPGEIISIRTFLMFHLFMLYFHYRVLAEYAGFNQSIAPYFSSLLNWIIGKKAPAFWATIPIHLLGLIWILWGGTSFVRSILYPIIKPPKKEVTAEEYRRGKIIGNLERLLIYVLFQINSPALISLVVGLKALARFRQLDDKEFAEYFLIGTLASVFFAIVISIFILWILREFS